jgi:hypothetical protein
MKIALLRMLPSILTNFQPLESRRTPHFWFGNCVHILEFVLVKVEVAIIALLR